MEKSFLETREILDKPSTSKYLFKTDIGINESVVRDISKDKNEPQWMLDFRLKCLKIFNELKTPEWGADLSGLDLDKITCYIKPEARKNAKDWNDVPEDIKKVFDRLGIPEAERTALAGAGAQFESEVVYHNIRKELEKQGVIFVDCDVALKEHEELFKKYFMKCIPPGLHKYAALHGAVWSGGTFIYVPKNIKVEMPLQAYFRMNSASMGQFEHTLIIVDEGAELHYVEGCFTKGNLVGTNPDYKPIETLEAGTKVLSHNGLYNEVRDLQVMPYTGKIYKISTYGDPNSYIEATEGHPFLYVDKKSKRDRNKVFDKRWNIPKYFKKNDYLVMPINKTIKENNFYKYEIDSWNNKKKKFEKEIVKVPSTKEFLKLLGYYLSEGSISSSYYVNFSFGEHEKELINEVKTLIKKVFGNISVCETYHRDNHGTNVVVSSVKLVRIFKNFGRGAKNKYVPQWAMIENIEKQKELLKAMFFGDGNYYNKKTKNNALKEAFRFSTISEKLARQIRDLLLRQGIVSFINKRDRSKENRQAMFTVGITGDYLKRFGDLVGIKVKDKINGKNRASMFGIDQDYAYFPIRSIETKKITNLPVYNFSVKNTETYTVNGFIVHNCSAPQYNSNSLHAGCVEIFVNKNARMRYSSVENWSRNTYNLNTKRAFVEEKAIMEWVTGNMGSKISMVYPCSMLKGENSRADHLSIAFANKNQHQDVGAKIYHLAKNTSSTVINKSIAKGGGVASYRGLIHINKSAINSRSNVRCDALMTDNESRSDTMPYMNRENKKSSIEHEATVSRIGEEQLFYLMSRGLSEEEARKMIVSGFIEPIIKELPIEYAIEMNKLIELEMEGSLG